MKSFVCFLLMSLAAGCSFEKKASRETPTDSTIAMVDTVAVNTDESRPNQESEDAPEEEDEVPLGNGLLSGVRNIVLEHTLYILKQWGATSSDGDTVIEMSLCSKSLPYGYDEGREMPHETTKLGKYIEGIGWLEVAYSSSIDVQDFPSYDKNIGMLENAINMQAGMNLRIEDSSKINPAVITWVFNNYYLEPQATLANKSLQDIYDVTFKRFVRTIAVAHDQLQNKFTENATWYDAVIIEGRGGQYIRDTFKDHFPLPSEKRNFVDPEYFPMASGFWVRRSIDGTEELLWGYTKKMLVDYDKDWACSNISDLCN